MTLPGRDVLRLHCEAEAARRGMDPLDFALECLIHAHRELGSVIVELHRLRAATATQPTNQEDKP